MSWIQHQAQKPAHPWLQNPVFVQLIGLSPMLGATTQFRSTLTVAMSTLIVIIFSAATISLLRTHIDRHWRFPAYLASTSIIAAVLIVLLGVTDPASLTAAGIYLPLVACNYLVLMELERVAYEQALWPSLKSACLCGIIFALTLLAFTALRQLFSIGLDSVSPEHGELTLLPGFALILLGAAMAAYQYLAKRLAVSESTTVSPARRARVTGRVRQ